MKVLVTGATGFIGGTFLAKTASDSRFSVRAALRTDLQFSTRGIEPVLVEGLTATADWHEALNGCRAVVHAAALTDKMQGTSTAPLVEFRHVNVQGTLNLARQAAEAGVKRFVFVSSVKVNGESTVPGQSFTADDLPSPVDPYGISKHEAENELRELMTETGMEVVIIRPPLVYGPGVKANFFKLLQLTQNHFPVPLGSVHNSRSMVYIGNLVNAITSCLEHPKAAGETFLVSDGEDVSTPELFRKLASAMGRKAILLPISLNLLKAIFSLTGKRAEIERLTGSLCVDTSKIREVLDWQPPYTLDQGIQETVDWYLARG
ncbi:SDR family oxidoreductase [Desulfopila sp. IMCC35006]|uniref:UDP-glucose 4-epimerase family protein n=1 Tax=Desulfopila sp. IMCC35006 TaxID=2569542 RepID=UPI0010ACF34B|nr:SDR family oxidoreductase [Desulfopila sp. IMCC35006]TKB26130.1 SDR family oxidoreductase [Desulfopila sp. IMCC35006]